MDANLTNEQKLQYLLDTHGIRLQRGALFDQCVHPKTDTFDFRRIEGMLLGVAIGDALGITTESMLAADRRAEYGELRDYVPCPEIGDFLGYPSDDTQLTFWTLEQLIADGAFIPERVAKRFTNGDHIIGIGRTTRGFIKRFKRRIPWYQSGLQSAGNGALMRITPIILPHLRTGGTALWADTALAAMMTHNDRAANSTCLAFVAMLWELLDCTQVPDAHWWVDRYVALAQDLEGETTYTPRGGLYSHETGPLWQFIATHVPEAYRRNDSVEQACNAWHSGAFLLETWPSVVYILMRYAHDPQEALVRAVNDTRDNDSIAAIVGAALGALYGRDAFPQRWVHNLSGQTKVYGDAGRVFELIAQAKAQFGSSFGLPND